MANYKIGFYRIYLVFCLMWFFVFLGLGINFDEEIVPKDDNFSNFIFNSLLLTIYYLSIFPSIFMSLNNFKDIKKIFKIIVNYFTFLFLILTIYLQINHNILDSVHFTFEGKLFVFGVLYSIPLISYFLKKIFNYIYDGFKDG